jgi:hypothetical protein
MLGAGNQPIRPGNLAVAMGVDIYEARCNEQALRVYDLTRLDTKLVHGSILPACMGTSPSKGSPPEPSTTNPPRISASYADTVSASDKFVSNGRPGSLAVASAAETTYRSRT